jgi:hypothetical protein
VNTVDRYNNAPLSQQITAHFYLRIKDVLEIVGTNIAASCLSVLGTSPAIAETVDCS